MLPLRKSGEAMSVGVNELVAIVSAIIAVVSLGLNWLIVRRQLELQVETLKTKMDSEVFGWSQDAISVVSHGVALIRSAELYQPDEFRRLAIQSQHDLAAIADRGRLFFPNELAHQHGEHNERAFQGIRPPILDAIVFASCQMAQVAAQSRDEPFAPAAQFLVKCRRLLVSEAQNAVDPRRREAIMKRLAIGRMDDTKSNFDVAYELGTALDARYPGLPVMAAWTAAQERIRNGVKA